MTYFEQEVYRSVFVAAFTVLLSSHQKVHVILLIKISIFDTGALCPFFDAVMEFPFCYIVPYRSYHPGGN